ELGRAAVTLEGVGAFPSSVHPNVIWAGVAQADRGKIVPMAERVIAELRGIGEEDSRPFEPHITLARVRSAAKREALVSFLQLNATRKFGSAELTHLKLKSSELTPRGPVYADVGVYPLR
ncbi:MAG: RNA 2',3'-cyclic phosphodiesterase, partial [Thaumarchaeota archaeon]